MVIPDTTVRPTDGETMKPDGLMGSGPRLSKFKYLLVDRQSRGHTFGDGLFTEEAMSGSPGCVMSINIGSPATTAASGK